MFEILLELSFVGCIIGISYLIADRDAYKKELIRFVENERKKELMNE